jgi:hypothetical protein
MYPPAPPPPEIEWPPPPPATVKTSTTPVFPGTKVAAPLVNVCILNPPELVIDPPVLLAPNPPAGVTVIQLLPL